MTSSKAVIVVIAITKCVSLGGGGVVIEFGSITTLTLEWMENDAFGVFPPPHEKAR